MPIEKEFENKVRVGLETVRPRVKRSSTGPPPYDIATPNPELDAVNEIWSARAPALKSDVKSIEESIVGHVFTSLGRQPYNLDASAAMYATALSLKDRLTLRWNQTQAAHSSVPTKRVYYMSLEFLIGRSMDSALINLNVRDEYQNALSALGFNLEDLLQTERDAALGNGGLGRLAACYMDSMATCNLPAFGYGIRYKYGMFKQKIDKKVGQIEMPDNWLLNGNPWEILRQDTHYDVRLYGQATRDSTTFAGTWTGGVTVVAVAYDTPIPGFRTVNTNTLRLWGSRAKEEFDLSKFNAGDYDSAVHDSREAENLTSVLYPNDSTDAGKELRLKQEYFFSCASLQDVLRRFRKLGKKMSELPDFAAIQCNDTHSVIALIELFRILIDEENIPFRDAFDIVNKTFGYTNHTVMLEACEVWGVPLVQTLLPRHMQIIFDLNLFFLQAVEKKFPNDSGILARMSIIGEGHPQTVRMANLAAVGTHCVNGVAQIHSGLVKTDLFPDFVKFYGNDKFKNVTNGITPARWILACNPKLAALVTRLLGNDDWVTKFTDLKGLLAYKDDPKIHREWNDIKSANQRKLVDYIKAQTGITVPFGPHVLFDVMCKRIHEYKRQQMLLLALINRYLVIKSMSAEERKNIVPRVTIFAGKAASSYVLAKEVILLIVRVAEVVNSDADVGDLLKIVFLEDYSVSLAEMIIPAASISNHISMAGSEASGTSCMKFCLNGALLLGTCDGANIELAEEIGDENVFLFGHKAEEVNNLRFAHNYKPKPLAEYSELMAIAVKEIQSGTFGDAKDFGTLLSSFQEDRYLVSDDFESFIQIEKLIDEAFRDTKSWTSKSIATVGAMSKFTSARAVGEYAELIWNVEPVPVTQEE